MNETGKPIIAGRIFHWTFVLPTALLFGCSVISQGPFIGEPEYPEEWINLTDGNVVSVPDVRELASWWTRFDDPVLTSLIDRAGAQNLDLQVAAERINEARGVAQVSRANSWPQLTLNAPYSFLGRDRDNGSAKTTELYSVSADFSWEVDLFERLKNFRISKEEAIFAREEDYRGVAVSLTAEVALTYVDLRTVQERIKSLTRLIQIQEQTFQMISWKVESGIASDLDKENAKVNLQSSLATLPTLLAAEEQGKLKLATLLAVSSIKLQEQIASSKGIPKPPDQLAVSIPASTLQNRPDVLSAEHQLREQEALLNVAEAERYPTLVLNGSIGLDALNAGELFDLSNRIIRLASSLGYTAFDAGATSGEIMAQTARKEIAVKNYLKTMLVGVEEVEGALVEYRQERERRDALFQGVEAAENAWRLAREEYEAGMRDFQTVLDAEKSLLQFQDNFVASEGKVVANAVNLYRALGGGF